MFFSFIHLSFIRSISQVMELCRPSDSRLEHVDFECLFSCLSLRLLLRVLGSLLLERRVIFTADKLRLVTFPTGLHILLKTICCPYLTPVIALKI